MRTYRILTALIATLIVAGCDSSSTAPDANNGGGSALAGKILHDNGKPFANLVVRLKSTGATTRTDANGAWSLPIPGATKAFTAPRGSAARTLETVDSVVVSTDSQTIAAEPVTDYHATLPDLYIVQRDLYGSLANFVPGKYVVTGYLTLPDGTTRTIPLWHNEVAHAFSGFIYTTYTTNVLNYSVRVVVRDTATGDTVTTGLSPVVPFNSTAGDVSIPVFSYKNVIPSAKIALSGIAALGNEVTLNAVVGDTDIVGGYMVVDTVKNKIEWLHEGVVVSNKKSIVVTLGADMFRDSTYTLRVTDDQDSLVATDKFSINLPKGEAVVVSNFDLNSLSLMSARQTPSFRSPAAVWAVIDSVYAAILGNDSNFIPRYQGNNSAILGDTIDLSSVDRNTRRATYSSCGFDSVINSKDSYLIKARGIFDLDVANLEAGSDSVKSYGFKCSDKGTATFSKAFNTTYLTNFRISGKGYAYMRLGIWSEKPIVIATAFDTVALKAGDNNVYVRLRASSESTVRDTVVLRSFPHSDAWEIRAGIRGNNQHAGYPALYADWFFTGKMPASFSGTYAGGLLKADNSDANSGKVVIKSVYGYK